MISMAGKKIYTEEELKERIKQQHRESCRKYYRKNKEKILSCSQTYYKENKEKHQKAVNEYRKKWSKTPIGRASSLVSAYNGADKIHNRGKGDLTAEWIVEHIFTQPCAHCGKTGWEVIGCNRIDNDKPHSKDNVEPCYRECNLKLPRKQNHISEYS